GRRPALQPARSQDQPGPMSAVPTDMVAPAPRRVRLFAGTDWSMRVGLAGIALLALAAALAPLILPGDPIKLNLTEGLEPPSLTHWFGTDQLGRDVLTRVIYGARIDLDRKSTRLNSSHQIISYAVFCLKK